MGWFDEQIRQRKENDESVLSEAVCNIVGAVSGEKVFFNIKDKKRDKSSVQIEKKVLQ
jgi:hypothetical protein